MFQLFSLLVLNMNNKYGQKLKHKLGREIIRGKFYNHKNLFISYKNLFLYKLERALNYFDRKAFTLKKK